MNADDFVESTKNFFLYQHIADKHKYYCYKSNKKRKEWLAKANGVGQVAESQLAHNEVKSPTRWSLANPFYPSLFVIHQQGGII